MARTRLGYVDALRGLGALAVALFWHYQHFAGPIQPGAAPFANAPGYGLPIAHTLYRHGYLAVDLFFMLSGMVFQHVYGGAERTDARRFFWHRVARLYPLHVLTLCVVAGLAWIFHARFGRFPIYANNSPFAFVANLLFVQGLGWWQLANFSFNGPSWSLSVEALLYGMFLITLRPSLAYSRIVLAAIGLVLWPVLACSGSNASGPQGLATFFIGTLLYDATRDGGRWWLLFYPPLMGLYAWAVFRLALHLQVAIDPAYMIAWAVFGTVLIGLRCWPTLARGLEWRALLWLGDRSLSIYLLHVPLQIVLLLVWHDAVPFGRFRFWAFYAALLLLLSDAVYRCFEVPARRWVRQITRC